MFVLSSLEAIFSHYHFPPQVIFPYLSVHSLEISCYSTNWTWCYAGTTPFPRLYFFCMQCDEVVNPKILNNTHISSIEGLLDCFFFHFIFGVLIFFNLNVNLCKTKLEALCISFTSLRYCSVLSLSFIILWNEMKPDVWIRTLHLILCMAFALNFPQFSWQKLSSFSFAFRIGRGHP